MLLTRRSTLAVLGAATAMPATAMTQPSPADRLRALIDASAVADAALNPLGRPGTARPPGMPVFVDPTTDAYAAAFKATKQRDLAALQGIDRAALGPIDAIARDVFDYQTRRDLAPFASGQYEIARQVPLDPSFGLHIEFADHVAGSGAAFATIDDYEAGLARLDGFATYLRNVITRLQQGHAAGRVHSRLIVENILKQVDAVLAQPIEASAFYSAIDRLPPALANDRPRLAAAYRQVIETRVYPGYRLWQSYLRETYLPAALVDPGRWAMRDGSALYAAELARHTTTTMSADAIHALGIAEVARIRSEMESVRRQLGFSGDLKALFVHVRSDPRFYCKTPDELLARFAAIEARIWAGIPKLFHHRPKAPFKVAPLPGLGEQRGTGYYSAGPADGVTPGVLFFNMAMLDTRPIPTLETLTLHEGIPGHHFQISLAQENAALPTLLRSGSNTAYAEGWGLYAESLGRELGMFTDPWQWFGHLDMEMLRAVRLVVDTGLHARRWPRQKAIDYMLDNTSMAPRDVAVEIDRYLAAPGQACAYKIGQLTMQRLRSEAARTMGTRFDIRDFHEQLLGTGALPLAVLERKVAQWAREIAAKDDPA